MSGIHDAMAAKSQKVRISVGSHTFFPWKGESYQFQLLKGMHHKITINLKAFMSGIHDTLNANLKRDSMILKNAEI